MPVGGGWTVDGHFIVGTAAESALHVWKLK